MVTSVIIWIGLGLVVGFIASKMVGQRSEAVPSDLLVSVVGAVIGGWIFLAIASAELTGRSAWSFLLAIVGAVVALLAWNAFYGTASTRHVHR